MKVVSTIAETRAALRELPRPHGLVPTMGYLHEGHLSLARQARRDNASVSASIFVNPAQFGPSEDFTTYPRDEQRDLALLEEAGTDLVYMPPVEVVYPPGFDTYVTVGALTEPLEGAARPGHFRGVATVVAKLFNVIQPDRAYFGQKDAQQAAVIRRMVRDLAVAVEIRVLPTVRDDDGLALSSRNAYLSAAERERALALPRALATKDPTKARELLRDLEVEYVEVGEFEPKVLAAAVRVGGTRLIDNIVLEGEET